MKLLSPNNSILLVEDPINREGIEAFEKAILEIKSFYRFVPLSKVIQKEKKYRGLGFACLVFKEARKFFFHSIRPFLREEKIPFTLILRPDEIGTNRLSITEEQLQYREKAKELVAEQERVFEGLSDKQSARDFLRKALGPFPFEIQDPLRFYMTWGQVLQVLDADNEVAMWVDAFSCETKFYEDLKFVKTQTGKEVQAIYAERNFSFLQSFPRLSDTEGFVEKSTPLQNLPQWKKFQIG